MQMKQPQCMCVSVCLHRCVCVWLKPSPTQSPTEWISSSTNDDHLMMLISAHPSTSGKYIILSNTRTLDAKSWNTSITHQSEFGLLDVAEIHQSQQTGEDSFSNGQGSVQWAALTGDLFSSPFKQLYILWPHLVELSTWREETLHAKRPSEWRRAPLYMNWNICGGYTMLSGKLNKRLCIAFIKVRYWRQQIRELRKSDQFQK